MKLANQNFAESREENNDTSNNGNEANNLIICNNRHICSIKEAGAVDTPSGSNINLEENDFANKFVDIQRMSVEKQCADRRIDICEDLLCNVGNVMEVPNEFDVLPAVVRLNDSDTGLDQASGACNRMGDNMCSNGPDARVACVVGKENENKDQTKKDENCGRFHCVYSDSEESENETSER